MQSRSSRKHSPVSMIEIGSVLGNYLLPDSAVREPVDMLRSGATPGLDEVIT
jgi:hypothetical protein